MGLPTITAIGTMGFKEMKQHNGNNICSFTINCSEKKYKGDGYDKFSVKCTVWNKQAEFVNQYFNDGDVLIAEGKLITETYEKQDGTKASVTKMNFPNVSFVPKAFSKNQDARQVKTEYETIPKNQTVPIDVPDGELPF